MSTANPVIALDVMGGDTGLSLVIAAAEIARERYPKLRFRLYGPEAAIRAALAKAPRIAADSVIVHTDQQVLGTDKPSQVIRRGRDTSMGLAISAVKAGEADATVSAGNTGALMAMAKLTLRTMEGIDRPAIAAVMPNRHDGYTTVLDLGANVDCSADHLLQFGGHRVEVSLQPREGAFQRSGDAGAEIAFLELGQRGAEGAGLVEQLGVGQLEVAVDDRDRKSVV